MRLSAAESYFKPFSDPKVAANLGDMIGRFAVSLVISALILVLTFWIAGLLARIIQRTFARIHPKGDTDTTLNNFVSSLVRYGVLVVGFIAVFQQLGVQMTSIVAVLGATSLAIGLALQGTLNNVAAGVMLLILRPYRVGDYVELAGRLGKVRALDLFTTKLDAVDGLRLVIPNGKIFGEVIVNYTITGHRRIELQFGLDYDDDHLTALAVLIETANADPRVQKKPPPWAKVTGLAESSVTCTLQLWVKSSDFTDTGPDLRLAAMRALTAAGMRFPYPHQVGLSRAEFLGQGDAPKA